MARRFPVAGPAPGPRRRASGFRAPTVVRWYVEPMTRTVLALLVAAVSSTACSRPECDEGEVRSDGECVPYEADPPVDPGAVWQPDPGTSWQWQLTGEVDTTYDVSMYDIDLFDAADRIAQLHDDGRVVICYFSAGSYEDWRPDASSFPDAALGKKLDGWAGERWLDITDDGVRDIMRARLDRARDAGCDGVEPDNMDGYANDNGVGLNATEQLDYNRFIADEAHRRGLSVGLKNDLDQLESLIEWYDWALNEECAAYKECGRMAVFLDAGKAVFHVEYVDAWGDATAKQSDVCGAVDARLDTLIKTWDLGAEYLACG